ncbi:hypothetical protein UFOVP1004_17 [uncultured Caudovirales phage]|uniref:Uncharacterized protein n=1 Tax=uncultured Caudovirales phage TaxID=2100421 RepID=A0A6J5Q8Z8_9CAUD|nr:hypothetical protein UFOVP1004_17 [uncultured Caudovirales phage]
MQFVRESQINDEGAKYAVVELEAGDTIPVKAIKRDGEWHVPVVTLPPTVETPETEKA